LLRELTDKPADLAKRWGLDRKIREWLVADEKYKAEDAANCVEAMLFVLGYDWTSLSGKKGSKQITPLSLFLANYQNEAFRALIGVNVYDDVSWFNKEKFEAALKFIPEILACDFDAGLDATLDAKLDEYVQAYSKAEALSAYRLDKFIDALSGGAPGAAAKKPGGKAKK
jgi:hypothetical protein